MKLTIARNNHELILLRDLVVNDFGVTSDNLRFRAEGAIFLVIEVAEGTGESEVTCHED